MDEDGHNTGAWEKVVHDLAAMCGLNVPESKFEKSRIYSSQKWLDSISLAIETAHHFGIKESDAQLMAQEITMIVRENWESLARKYNISRGQLEDMRPAFSACYEEG